MKSSPAKSVMADTRSPVTGVVVAITAESTSKEISPSPKSQFNEAVFERFRETLQESSQALKRTVQANMEIRAKTSAMKLV